MRAASKFQQFTDAQIEEVPYTVGEYEGRDGIFVTLTERAVAFIPCAEHSPTLILDMGEG